MIMNRKIKVMHQGFNLGPWSLFRALILDDWFSFKQASINAMGATDAQIQDTAASASKSSTKHIKYMHV